VKRLLRVSIALLALLLLIAGSAPAQQEPVRVTEEGILVDFQDADLRLVITALAEAGNLNVIYGDLPPRRITLRLRQPVPTQNLLALLRSIAQSNGLTLVEEGNLVRIEGVDPRDIGARGGAGARAAEEEQQPDPRLFVLRLKHARANRLAGTLQSIFGGRTAGLETQRRPALSERLREQRLPPADTMRREPEVRVEVGPATPPPGLQGRLEGDIQIVPEEATNSLLIRATPTDYEIVRQAVVALDLRPLQVLIEVLIAEVRHTRDLDISVSGRASNEQTTPGLTGELKGNTVGDLIIKMTKIGGLDLDATLSALSARGKVRILSRPVILAQNNQEARILIGDERPFVQVFRSLPTDAGVRDQVVQYRDVGTQLTITPTINDDQYVNLQVTQEVSTATAETQFGAPVISTREAATHLFIRNGQTAVIGGLIERQENRSRTGIPLLMDIPVLGGLFGTTRINNTNSELFVFLTPHVIETDEDTERLREQIGERSEMVPPGAPLIPPSDTTGQARRP
jgi:general secretion pathway protein D